MINLTLGNTNTIIVTPKENTSLNFIYYKIVFTNRITKDVINFWFTDTSTTNRYQKCTIIVNNFFANFDTGFYDYVIYGCATSGGTPNSPVLESGYMVLHPSTEFAPTNYNEQSNTFITYNG
jgi:hypothetical protein